MRTPSPRQGGLLQAPGEAGRVEHGDAVAVPQAGEEGRRVDLGAQGVLVEEGVPARPEPRGVLGELLEFGDLVGLGGDVDLAGALEGAVDVIAGDGLPDGVEVADAELFEGGQFVRPAGQAVAEAVGEGGGAEAAVAPGGRPADLGAFDEDDVALGVALLGDQCGPQPRVAAADDEQIAGLVADEGGPGGRAVLVGQPEGGGFGVRERMRGGRGHGSSCHGSQLLLLLLRRAPASWPMTTHNTATRNIAVPMTLI